MAPSKKRDAPRHARLAPAVPCFRPNRGTHMAHGPKRLAEAVGYKRAQMIEDKTGSPMNSGQRMNPDGPPVSAPTRPVCKVRSRLAKHTYIMRKSSFQIALIIGNHLAAFARRSTKPRRSSRTRRSHDRQADVGSAAREGHSRGRCVNAARNANYTAGRAKSPYATVLHDNVQRLGRGDEGPFSARGTSGCCSFSYANSSATAPSRPSASPHSGRSRSPASGFSPCCRSYSSACLSFVDASPISLASVRTCRIWP